MNRDALLAAAAFRTAEAAPALCAAKFSKASAASLGLVHSSTSDTRHLRRVSVELDQNRIRAARLRKSIITGARLHDEEARQGSIRGHWYMLTATYAEGRDFSPRDISELVKRVRGHFYRFARRKGLGSARLRYLWVGELTRRLRPHYHLLIWIPRGFFIPMADRRGWWPHGMTRIERARNAVGYLAKYASKFTSAMAAAFPKGFRTHGVGGLSDESRRELRWWKSPLEAREALGPDADIRKVFGGYADRRTGSYWPSPWRVCIDRGRVVAWKLELLS